MLDGKFFRKSEAASQGKFVAYENVYQRSTMILSSTKTGTPIAAVTLVSGTPDTAALVTARPPPVGNQEENTSFFQGMLNKDGALFSFAVTNLGMKGHLLFQVFQVGSELPVNEVNCVEANSTYVIPCDQRSGQAMSIQSRKDKANPAQDQTLKEAEADKKVQVLQFKVVIKPETGNLLFEGGTQWSCQLGFVRQEEPPKFISKGRGGFGGELVRELGMSRGGFGGREEEEFSMGGGLFGAPEMSRGFGARAGAPEMSRGGDRGGETRGGTRGGDRGGGRGGGGWTRGGSGGRRDMSMGAARGISNSSLQKKSKSAPKSAPVPQASAYALESRSLHLEEKQSSAMEIVDDNDDGKGDEVDVGATSAVDLVYSGDKVQVKSRSVELDFSDVYVSAPMIMGISLWRTMKVNPIPNIQAWLKEQVEEATKNEGKVLLQQVKQVYKSEFCVVLADEETRADTVIIQCGHCCVNHQVVAKLDKCPLCRGHIMATCLLGDM
jgi:hypothetical protein